MLGSAQFSASGASMSDNTRNVAGLQLSEATARGLEAGLAASTSPEALRFSKGALLFIRLLCLALWIGLAVLVYAMFTTNSRNNGLESGVTTALLTLGVLGVPLTIFTLIGSATVRANKRIIRAIETAQ